MKYGPFASFDQVSKGRLIVGVGAGHVGAEFAAMGAELSERGARMNEFIGAMRALWTTPRGGPGDVIPGPAVAPFVCRAAGYTPRMNIRQCQCGVASVSIG